MEYRLCYAGGSDVSNLERAYESMASRDVIPVSGFRKTGMIYMRAADSG